MSDETTLLQSLSKLKMAGKLRYWRGTIEIPESELHAICDEIQAEHEQAIAATLGSGAMSKRKAYISMPRHNGERYAKLMVNQFKQINATLGNAKLGSGTCEIECFDDGVDEGLDGEWFSYSPPTWYLSCGHTAQGTEKPNFCPSCGRRVVCR